MFLKHAQRGAALLAAAVLSLTFVFSGGVSAQDGSDAEGFPLGAAAAYCEPDHAGPFVGCTPWEGVTVSFVSADGSFNETCVTSGGERAAGCGVTVPFGSTITASIDPAIVPDGYYLGNPAVQEWEIPDGPPTGEFGGPVFVLYAQGEGENGADEDTPVVDDVDTLPKTGSGVADSGTSMTTVMPALLMGVAAVLTLGARQVRQSRR